MARIDVLDILRSKQQSPLEFNFDSLWIPPMYNYLTSQDIEDLRKIATSVRLSSRINEKYEMINNIMNRRGFKRFSAGTNRVAYSFLEDTRFLVKIAVDKVGMQDNPMEYKNQFLLKPYVTKMFYHSPCGTVGFVERVLPVKNKAEFKEIADDVFEILVHKILGKYVMEDIGTRYFMNWGVRMGSGPCLLDFPYLYKLDGKKLYCTKKHPATGAMCNGEIDYDAGFNHLVCNRCGKIYLASDLRDDSVDNKIIIKKGGLQMKVSIEKGGTIIASSIKTDDVMRKPKKENNSKLKVSIHYPDNTVITSDDGKDTNPIVSPNPTNENDNINGRENDKTTPENNTEIKKSDEDQIETKVPEETTNSDETKVSVSDDDNGIHVSGDDERDAADNETSSEEDKTVDDNADTSAPESDTDIDTVDGKFHSIADNDDYDKFDDSPVRVKTRRSTPRDDKGRFISTNKRNNKAKSNFIPSNK